MSEEARSRHRTKFSVRFRADANLKNRFPILMESIIEIRYFPRQACVILIKRKTNVLYFQNMGSLFNDRNNQNPFSSILRYTGCPGIDKVVIPREKRNKIVLRVTLRFREDREIRKFVKCDGICLIYIEAYN